MGLETVSNGRISELVDTNPVASDKVNKGDDHIRNIKKVIKDTFSGINAENGVGDNLLSEPVTANSRELNILDGATVTTAELNILDGATVTTAELNVLDGISEDLEAADLNILDGVTATTDELNHVGGVTSAIQDQIDDKQDNLTAGINITIDAVTENEITTTTITASGAPYAVVIDDKIAGDGWYIGVGDDHNAQVDTIIHSEDDAVTENDNTVYLPAGTYYFEGMAHVYNPSGSGTNGDVRVGLYTDGGTLKGYEGVGFLGERDGREFTCMGKFTTTGDRYRLNISVGEGPAVYYGRQGDAGIASYIKFWKVD